MHQVKNNIVFTCPINTQQCWVGFLLIHYLDNFKISHSIYPIYIQLNILNSSNGKNIVLIV